MVRVKVLFVIAIATIACAAQAVEAAPLYNIQMLASTSKSGPYTSDIEVTPGTTYYYELVGQVAPIGTTNGSKAVTALTPGTDGSNAMSFKLLADGSNSIQMSFLTSVLAGPSTTPSATQDWAAAASQTPGTFASVGGGTNNQISLIHGGHASGIYTGTSPDVLLIGTFSIPATPLGPGLTSLVVPSYGSDSASSSLKINNGATSIFITASTESGNSPYVGYSPLTLHTASVPEPSTIVLAGMGAVAGLAVLVRRRKKVSH